MIKPSKEEKRLMDLASMLLDAAISGKALLEIKTENDPANRANIEGFCVQLRESISDFNDSERLFFHLGLWHAKKILDSMHNAINKAMDETSLAYKYQAYADSVRATAGILHALHGITWIGWLEQDELPDL